MNLSVEKGRHLSHKNTSRVQGGNIFWGANINKSHINQILNRQLGYLRVQKINCRTDFSPYHPSEQPRPLSFTPAAKSGKENRSHEFPNQEFSHALLTQRVCSSGQPPLPQLETPSDFEAGNLNNPYNSFSNSLS